MTMGSENKRKSERIEPRKPFEIVLNGISYPVVNVSSEGFGFLLKEKGQSFLMGQRIDKIPIESGTETRYVQGVISHITKNELGTVCGIRLIFTGSDEYKTVSAFMRGKANLEGLDEKKS
jgi:hypothetical protein